MASAIEKLLNPPQVERRPPWYQGEGDPSWAKGPPAAGERRQRSFSMLRLGLLVSMLCVSMGALSIRYRIEQKKAINHQKAVARIVQLGGTVQQGEVSLAGTAVKDEDLACLADLRHIAGVNLGSTGITNEGLSHISDLATIQTLTLSGTNIDDDGLRHLQRLPRLSVVLLRQTGVTGKGLRLSKNASLFMLDMSRCPVSRQGLVQIAEQPCRVLSLAETPISDEMLGELKVIDVEHLDVTGTELSPSGVSELQAHRPGLQLRKDDP